MALISLRQLLDHAAEHQYGLPAFNVNNMEQIHAIMQAGHTDALLRDPVTVLMKLMPFFFPLSQSLVIRVPQCAQPSRPMLCIQQRLEQTHRSD